jgi:hypothetical protein
MEYGCMDIRTQTEKEIFILKDTVVLKERKKIIIIS